LQAGNVGPFPLRAVLTTLLQASQAHTASELNGLLHLIIVDQF
jgi:hypothetical protein